MEKIQLGPTKLMISKLIFGTAKLHNILSKKERLKVLNLAVETGFSHFDTSPLYGFGMAERDLGELLRLNPEVTITSKFGLFSPGRKERSNFEVYAQKSIGKIFPVVATVKRNFELDFAKRSLESSLVRLNRDYIDIYLLHEPPKNLVNLEEIYQFLLDAKFQGLIRSFGVAGKWDVIEHFRNIAPEILEVIQMEVHSDFSYNKIRDLGIHEGIITYGHGSFGARNDLSYLESIENGITQNSNGAIIVSTTKRNRMNQYQEIAKDSK